MTITQRIARWWQRTSRCKDCGYTAEDWRLGIPGTRRGVVHVGPCTWDVD
jgi:hypothetical protein